MLHLLLGNRLQVKALLRTHPDALQHTAQDPIIHFLRDEAGQETSHVVEILRAFAHLAVEDAEVEGVQLPTAQVHLAGLDKFIHVKIA